MFKQSLAGLNQFLTDVCEVFFFILHMCENLDLDDFEAFAMMADEGANISIV
jgi:hypothetical protein